MGALTIKTYAFQYRPWELESQTFTNLFSTFPENLVLYFKNKKLIRILSEFNNEFLVNKIRFSQKKIEDFLFPTKIKLSAPVVFWCTLFYLFTVILKSSFSKLIKYITRVNYVKYLTLRSYCYICNYNSWFFSLQNLEYNFIHLNNLFETFVRPFVFLNKISFFTDSNTNFLVFTNNIDYFKELILNNICNLQLIGFGKIKSFSNFNLKKHITLGEKKDKLFLSLFFFYSNHFTIQQQDYYLENSISSSIVWLGLSPFQKNKDNTFVSTKYELYYNSTLLFQRPQVLTWCGTFKRVENLISN